MWKPVFLFVFFCFCSGARAAHAQGESRAAIFPQLGHTFLVSSVAFSPDGKWLASSGFDDAVRLWEVASGREVRSLIVGRDEEDNRPSVAFSPNGKMLAVGVSKTITIWDPATGRQIGSLRESNNDDDVVSIAFSPDGKLLASANGKLNSDDRTIVLWDVASGSQLRTIRFASEVTTVAFSPNGTTLASGHLDDTVRLWDAATGRELRTMLSPQRGGESGVESVAFSPDGKTLASGDDDNSIKLWDVASGRNLNTLSRGQSNGVRAVAFSRDGRLLASGDGEGHVALWDPANGNVLRTARGESGATLSVAFSSDGKILATGGQTSDLADFGAIQLIDVATGRELRPLQGHAGEAESVTFSRNGQVLLVGRIGGAYELWSVAEGRLRSSMGGSGKGYMCAALSPDAQLLATGIQSGTEDGGVIKLWNTSSGRELQTLVAHQNFEEVCSLEFSLDGKTLASSDDDGTISLWDMASGQRQRTVTGFPAAVKSPVFSTDWRLLALGAGDYHLVKLWDMTHGRQLRTIDESALEPVSVALSPDGGTLAYATEDASEIRLWSVATGRRLHSLNSKSGGVNSVAFSRDGRLLAAGGNDGKVVIWDVANGTVRRQLVGHEDEVRSVAFSPNGRLLASSSWDGTTRVWNVGTGIEVASLIAFDDGSSIAVTPEGFFGSSSAVAEENLNVRIGDRVFGISSFRDTFYRPDLVRRSLAGEDISQFGDIANVKLSPEIELGDLPATTADQTLTLSVKLTDGGGGLGSVRVFKQGTVILQDDSKSGLTRSYAIPLSSGDNQVRVAASNASGDMWSMVDGSVTANLAANDDAAGPKGVLHAIVIGIDDFPKSPGDDLKYAVSDADLFADTLAAKAEPLFKSLDIERLTTAGQTDREHLLAAVRAMQAKVGPDDAFVFYVASHGVVSGGEYYLVTSNLSGGQAPAQPKSGLVIRGVSDIAPEHLRTEAVGRRELTDLLANIATTHKAVFIDTCQAGGLAEVKSAVSMQGMDPQTAATIISRQIGLTMLMAATTNQEALEGYQNHGLFTFALADGLSGKAADPTTGVVTSDSLARYVDATVPAIAKTFNSNQQPTDSEAGKPFPIAKAR